jgi:transcriptional antiterminator RfaH
MASPDESRQWYCVRTQTKHEHIAAAHLRRSLEIEVFNPKLRIRRATRRGAVWFLEALFPGYIFARFDWTQQSQAVRGARGVSTLVTFGTVAPAVPDAVVEHLRSQFDENEAHEVPDDLQQGDTVTIGGGPFHGLEATVLRVMTATNRIQILLEILGGTKPVEIPLEQVALEARKSQLRGQRTPFEKDSS